MIGIPYVYTLSSILRARLDYLREMYDIKEKREFKNKLIDWNDYYYLGIIKIYNS